MDKKSIMEFGLLLFVLFQMTTFHSSVAISNDTIAIKNETLNKSRKDVPVPVPELPTVVETGNDHKNESEGFIKQMTTTLEGWACKVGFLCEKKTGEDKPAVVETGNKGTDEKQKIDQAENVKNSELKPELKKPESEPSTSAKLHQGKVK